MIMDSPLHRSGKKLFLYSALAAIFVLAVLDSLELLAFFSNRVQTRGQVSTNCALTNCDHWKPIYENNSFPFQTYASKSMILALPAISSWLAHRNYTVNEETLSNAIYHRKSV
jgi:hypothetical protein